VRYRKKQEGQVESIGGMSWSNMSFAANGMPAPSLSKLFEAGQLSMDLNQPDLSLTGNIFNSKLANGSFRFPRDFSTDLNSNLNLNFNPAGESQDAPPFFSLPGLSNSLIGGGIPAADPSSMQQSLGSEKGDVQDEENRGDSRVRGQGQGQIESISPASHAQHQLNVSAAELKMHNS
jgi:hypothetical protein